MSDTYTGVIRTYYDKEQTKLKEEYFQVNGKKEGIKKHAHSNNQKDNFICANLFIYGDENIGTTFILNEKQINYKNNVGEIIFFPCNLEHYVKENNGIDIRITMAFDIHLNIEMQDKKRYYIIKK